MTIEKHKSARSLNRLFGQSVDAQGNVSGAPIEVRFAYPNIHKQRTMNLIGKPLQKPRYDVTILVPKLAADAAQCPNYAALSAHCMEAVTKAWGQWPQGGKWPIQDGDIPHARKMQPGQAPLTPEQIAEKNKWRVGYWIIEATNYSEVPPKVLLQQQGGLAREIEAQNVAGSELYKSGDWGYVFLSAWTYHNETFGVNFGFEGVMFIRSGEKIGTSGPRSAASMFGSVAQIAPRGAAPALPNPGHPMAPGGIAHSPSPAGFAPPAPSAGFAPPAPSAGFAPPSAQVYAGPPPQPVLNGAASVPGLPPIPSR